MITAQLATIPSRTESVIKTIESLMDQVDYLICRANDYTDATRLIDLVMGLPNHKARIDVDFTGTYNRGDAEKFFGCDDLTGYILTCDDDLIYPPDYAARMIEAVDRYGGEAIVSLHGRELRPGKISSYYAPSNRLQAFHCLKDVDTDHRVTNGAIGTGVMAWNADKVKIRYDWFKTANMADVYLAVNARREGIPMVIVAHHGYWLQYIDQPEGTTIWEQHFNNDSQQTEVWNSGQI